MKSILIMEILNNISLNYSFITFVVIEVFMFFILFIITKEPKNKVKFFVVKEPGVYGLRLFLGKPTWNEDTLSWTSDKVNVKLLATNFTFKHYNLNSADFDNMKIGEIKEVFLNLKDWLWNFIFVI